MISSKIPFLLLYYHKYTDQRSQTMNADNILPGVPTADSAYVTQVTYTAGELSIIIQEKNMYSPAQPSLAAR